MFPLIILTGVGLAALCWFWVELLEQERETVIIMVPLNQGLVAPNELYKSEPVPHEDKIEPSAPAPAYTEKNT